MVLQLKKKVLILLRPLTNFEIDKYYEVRPKFNGVYSRDNVRKIIKNVAYAINFHEYAQIGSHWVALYLKNGYVKNNGVKDNNAKNDDEANEANAAIYFDSFGLQHIPKEILLFIRNKDVKTDIFRIQEDNSIMGGYFCIGFIDFMFAGRSLIGFTSLFSPYYFKENDEIILDYFI